jgi:mannosyltransferase OCH1-like enzyme
MNIIERNIELDKLQDGTTDDLCIKVGYNLLQFQYDSDYNYTNSEPLPKIIHFIWIGAKIPQKYVDTIANCKCINTNYRVICWVDDNSISLETINFLRNSGLEIKNIYNYINTQINDNSNLEKYILSLLGRFDNFGYKADIIRLYVVYKFGGIYSDIDSIWLKPLDHNFEYDFVSYRIDHECSNCTNSFFGFHKESIFIKNALFNLRLTVDCFSKPQNYYFFKTHIPVITGPVFLTRIIKESRLHALNFIHQGYNVIGGPHEKIYSSYSANGLAYCYQTFDKNWC